MELAKPKSFEKPDAGVFNGTIIDVVDMPNVQTAFGLKNKIRVLWILGKIDGTPALTKDGKESLTVAGFYNAVLADNSNLTKTLRQILNGQPPLMTTTEQIAQLLIGRSNQLFLVKGDNVKNPADPFTNVAGIAPLPAGAIAPAIPAGYVRVKDQVKTVAGPQAGQTTQTYSQPQAPSNNVSFTQSTTAPVAVPTRQQF